MARTMAKKQKVRFHKGDRKPKSDKEYDTLSYKIKMKKRGRKFVWQVIEKPTNNAVANEWRNTSISLDQGLTTSYKYVIGENYGIRSVGDNVCVSTIIFK